MTDSMRDGKSVGRPVSDAEDNLLRQVEHWADRARRAEAQRDDLLADCNSLRAEMQEHVDLRYQAEAVAKEARAKAHRMDQHIRKLCGMIEDFEARVDGLTAALQAHQTRQHGGG